MSSMFCRLPMMVGGLRYRSPTALSSIRKFANVSPSVDDITNTQRKILGCPDYNENMVKTWEDAPIQLDGKFLKIQGHPVMEGWEHPYMARLAEIATSRGGRVLELGFGMAISATYIQSHYPKFKEHWIIEANKEVAEKARVWSKETAKSQVEIKRGFSWDMSPQLETGSFDGILYDTYPLKYGAANKHHRDFFPEAARLLRKGGVFTYFCNEDIDVADEEKALLNSFGFDITTEQVDVKTPEDCQYWRAKTIVAPTCIKR
ncbi:unnamed protein product [Polarella glacialis]|uniref:Guanidinoacetate N-methyltransferase n=1 Tax=Polarella glacialis TaxID=89957 RepID=A0A813GZ82_POLGL|nr:unnamed protein product [Polarella glacialis]CAE8645712.1 unnamed protein product [Polarella glacialis]